MDNTNDELKDLYATQDQRIDTILVKDKAALWAKIVKMLRLECVGKNNAEITEHVAKVYGIKLHFNDNGIQPGWAPDCEVIDPELYTLFLLKYS